MNEDKRDYIRRLTLFLNKWESTNDKGTFMDLIPNADGLVEELKDMLGVE